jgi:hypothetical protein
MNNNIKTAAFVVLFITLFMIIGTVAPVLAYTYMPQSSFVEVNDFSVTDTYVGDESHKVCFDRNVKRATSADINIELLLVRDDGTIVEEDSFEVDAYFQKGSKDVVIDREIRAETLKAGQYKYINSVELDYYNGWVHKQFKFESEEFRVFENKEQYEKYGEKTC